MERGNGADWLPGNLRTCGTGIWSRRPPEDVSDTLRVATRTRPKPSDGIQSFRHTSQPAGNRSWGRVYLHLGTRRDELSQRQRANPMAAVDPDQEAALRRLRVAFGFVRSWRSSKRSPSSMPR